MRFKTFLSIGVIFLLSSVLALAALDLRFTTAISQAPDPANLGDTVTFTVTLISDGAIVNNLKLIGGVDGTQIVEKIFAGIADGGTRTQSMNWTATAGAHTVWFELDPDHIQGDSNYGNNRIEKAITVGGGGPAGQPDLTPVVTYSPAKFDKGDAVTFSFRVNNNGTAASSACDMILKQDGPMWAPFTVPVIEAGGHWQTSYTWYAKCDAALEIEVDTNDQNLESNEGNNTWSKKMVCGKGVTMNIGNSRIFTEKAKPDLTVKIALDMTVFHSDRPEDRVYVNAYIQNIGAADSSFCEVVLKKGDTVVETIKIGAMHGGQSVSRKLGAIAKCGDKLTVQIDSNNVNIESNEDNNFASKTIVCLGNLK
jgi:subtilase family serine protease